MAEQPEQREITVLVKFQTMSGTSRNRPVIFSGSKIDLVRQTRYTFSDIVVAEDSDIYFQLEDQTWGPGVLVDLLDQEVEDRSILIAFEKVLIFTNFYVHYYTAPWVYIHVLLHCGSPKVRVWLCKTRPWGGFMYICKF